MEFSPVPYPPSPSVVVPDLNVFRAEIGPPEAHPPLIVIRIEYCPARLPLSFSSRLLGSARKSPNTAAWLSWSSFRLATRTRSDGHALRACLVSRPSKRSSVPWSRNDAITLINITEHVIHGNVEPGGAAHRMLAT